MSIFRHKADAYIDPNTGGFFFTSILPFVYGILAAIVIFWKRIVLFVKNFISKVYNLTPGFCIVHSNRDRRNGGRIRFQAFLHHNKQGSIVPPYIRKNPNRKDKGKGHWGLIEHRNNFRPDQFAADNRGLRYFPALRKPYTTWDMWREYHSHTDTSLRSAGRRESV